MNVFRSISLATRKLSIVIAIILLVSLSLFLYYFKYIPANKERLQHQGFLILRQQQDGIQQNLEDLKSYFCVQKQLFLEGRNKKKDNSNFFYTEYKDRPLNYSVTYRKGISSKRIPQADICSPSVFFDLDTISFRFNSTSDSIVFKIPLYQLFEKVLDPVKSHFFRYHFIVCKQHLKTPEGITATSSPGHEGDSLEKKPHILYYSHGLAVSEEMEPDSLGKRLSSSQFSKIIDMEMSGSSYKAFMLPFQLGHNTLILTGLMPGVEYRQRQQNIPFSTVNAIIIVFILILISLPYVKVFFISPEEHFGIRDIVLLGVTLFAGTAIFLIILQQGLMQIGARLRTRDNLDSLSYKINQRFRSDISHAYAELKYLDSSLAVLKDSDTTLKQPKINKVLVEKDSFRDTLFVRESASDSGYLLPFPKTNSFPSYTLAHWADSGGQQVYKGLFRDASYTFSNIGYRQYFKDVSSKHLYSFTNNADDSLTQGEIDSFTIQPVYSMSTNTFEVNIAIPGKAATMAALSVRINSVMNTILPRGYGFYVIDNKGLIQFQSEGTVTLQENFLEWINDKQNLSNTIKNRQSRFVADQYIDDRQFSLFVRPIDQLPLYLVVYHCNDFTTASILHINAFMLFFLFILLSMLLVLCFISWTKTNHFSKLNQPIHQFDWVKPAYNKSNFFINANFYLLTYIFFTVLYGFFVLRYSTIWFIGVVFPVFTTWTLYILFRLHVHFKGSVSLKMIPRRLFRFLLQPYNLVAFTFLGLLNVIYSRFETNPGSLIFYEIISLLFIPALIMFTGIYNKLAKEGRFSKLVKENMLLYNFFLVLSVIAISIIPVTCFFIYAQQKEINLLIKAQQLDTAENIENRLSKFDWFDTVVKKKNIPYEQRTELLFKTGVYDDRCIFINTNTDTTASASISEPYDEVIRSISWRYKSLDNVLPGQNAATDRKWYRNDLLNLHPALMTLNYKLGPENRKANLMGNANSLQIKCATDSIFKYFRMENTEGILIILLSSMLLMIMFFRLIRTVTGRLFHIWDFIGEDTIDLHKRNMVRKQLIKNEFDEYNGIAEVLKRNEEDPDKKYESLKERWEKEYMHNKDDKDKMRKQEDEILYNQYHLSVLYENLWNLCTKEERYFLYDMARDGFVNYKRAHLVQQLLYKGLLINYDNEELKKKNEELKTRNEELKQNNELQEGNEELKKSKGELEKSNKELEENKKELKNNKELKIMSVSFRNFILDKEKSEEVTKLKEEFHVHGTWSKLRTPILIAIIGIGTFIFITQQDIFQRVAALVPTISALLGLGTLILGSKVKQGIG